MATYAQALVLKVFELECEHKEAVDLIESMAANQEVSQCRRAVRYLKDPLRYEQSLISVRGLLWDIRASEIYRAVHGKEALKKARIRGQRVGQLLDLDSDPRAVAHCALIDGYLHDLNIAENYWGFRLDAEAKVHTLVPTCEHCGAEGNCLCELENDAPSYDEAEYDAYITDGGPVEHASGKRLAEQAAVSAVGFVPGALERKAMEIAEQEAAETAKEEPMHSCLVCGAPATNEHGDRCDSCSQADAAAFDAAVAQARAVDALVPGPNTIVVTGEELTKSVTTGHPVVVDLRQEEPMSTLDLIRQFKTDTNLYQGHNVPELKAYCRELGLKGYSSWKKSQLVRELASLAGLEIQMFAGQEGVVVERIEVITEEVVVSEDEKEADAAREATVETLEAEKDAQPAPPAPKFSEEDIAYAQRQIEIWKAKPRTQAVALAIAGWALRKQIMEGINAGRDVQALVALYREKSAQYKALGAEETKPVANPKPAASPTLSEQLAAGLSKHGIRYHVEGDRLILDEDGIAIRLAKHGKETIERVIHKWLRPRLWARNGWVAVSIVKEK